MIHLQGSPEKKNHRKGKGFFFLGYRGRYPVTLIHLKQHPKDTRGVNKLGKKTPDEIADLASGVT